MTPQTADIEVASQPNEYHWEATEGQTVFTLPSSVESKLPLRKASVQLYVGGAPQTNYSITNETTITLGAGAPGGATVSAYWTGVYVVTGAGTDIRTLDNYQVEVADKISLLSDVKRNETNTTDLITTGMAENTAKDTLNSAIVSNDILLPNKPISVNGILEVNTSRKIIGNKRHKITNINNALTGDFKINGSDVEIVGLNIDGQMAQSLYTAGTLMERISILNSILKTTGIGFQINTANNKNILIQDSEITTDSYPILLNTNADGGEFLKVLFNKLYSKNADALAFNNPSTTPFRGVIAIGNNLTADEFGTHAYSGFGVSIAKTRDVIVLANISKKSRQEGLHIEDDQENVTALANVFRECMKDGARILNKANAKPVIVSGNHFVKKDLAKTDNGIYRVNDANGSLDSILTENVVRGFDVGFYIDGSAYANVTGSVAEDCNYALRSGSNGRIAGTLYANRCTTLIKAGNGVTVDKIVSKTKPTNIIEFVGVASGVGATLKGLEVIETVTTASATTQLVDLFKLPSLLNGKIIVKGNVGTSDKIMAMADVLFDGTTLTVNNLMTKKSGVFDTITLVNNNGQLAVRFYSGSVKTMVLNHQFDGLYYVES